MCVCACACEGEERFPPTMESTNETVVVICKSKTEESLMALVARIFVAVALCLSIFVSVSLAIHETWPLAGGFGMSEG